MEVSDFPISITKPINNDRGSLTMSNEDYMASVVDNPFAYEQAMFDMNRRALIELNKYFPYRTLLYQRARDVLSDVASFGLDAETINNAHSDLLVYMLANEEHSDFNGELPKNDTGNGPMSSREYYTNHFARDLFNHLEVNPQLKAMPIFQYMVFNTNEENDNVSMNIQGIGGLAPYQKEAIKDSWSELNEKYPQIAKDLFLYNYFKLGFVFSPMAFMNLAPTSVKQSIKVPSESNPDRTYADYLKELQSGSVMTNTDEFVKQFILNHLDNKRFVYEAKSKMVLDYLAENDAYKAGLANSSFTIDVTDAANKSEKLERVFVTKKEKDGKNTLYTFRPVIKVGNDVFMIDDTGIGFAISMSPVAKYVKVESLGTKGKSLQYHSANATIYANTETEDKFVEGSTNEEPIVENSSFNRAEALNTLAEEFTKALAAKGVVDEYGQPYSLNDVRTMFDSTLSDDKALETMVSDLREACRKDGVLMLDDEGNMLKGC